MTLERYLELLTEAPDLPPHVLTAIGAFARRQPDPFAFVQAALAKHWGLC